MGEPENVQSTICIKENRGIKKRKKIKKNSGITLIALVITIIVLVILAGVSITMISGQDGILTRAGKAKEATEKAKEDERKDLDKLADLIENGGQDFSGFNETDNVNSPVITEKNNDTGIIPIKWNGSNWVVCSEDDEEWYNYSDGNKTTSENKTVAPMTWANGMLSDGKYKKGKVGVGQVIEQSDLGSMFVWIPRYAYSINEYKISKSATEGTTQGITKIEFLKGTSNIGVSGTQYATDYDTDSVTKGSATPMIVHSAFKFNEKNVKGLWVAKFEASMAEENKNTTTNNNVTDKTVKVLPNAESWRYIKIGNIFTNCLKMKENSIYQLASNSDSHLMKNSEWGAVAYLAASQYGVVPARNGAGTSEKVTGSDGKETTIYHSYTGNKNYTNNLSQSTTGNITGIFDLNGGAYEYVASYWENESRNLSNENTGTPTYFSKNENKLNSAYEAYWDKYSAGEEEIKTGSTTWYDKTDEGNKKAHLEAKDRVKLMKDTKGDAMYEVINTFSYYGWLTKDIVSGSTTYKAGEQQSWFTATEDASGNITTNSDRLWNYGRTFYNDDFALVGGYHQPFLLRGGYWYSGDYTGVFASCANGGNGSDSKRFSSGVGFVAL